ncbi:DUF2017 family protein [Microbacterium sp.]|uniref:DUF2017 family protein n=1 Tax=Microbacterium sp. TaxID=51671 RepID=UPI0028118E10|nr:DUF2017 family protein [Microbacterium sp.]
MSAHVSIQLAAIEVTNLLSLVDELVTVFDDPRSAADPGMARLTPDAYPADEAASRQFRQATRDSLLERRRADAITVRDTLEPLADSAHPVEVALREQRLVLTPQQCDAWMRTLAAMRLVVAPRLGIVGSDDHDPDDPRFAVYDWLGYRLELLVRAADEHDLPR